MLTFAIGDIHGCLGLLERLLALIEAEAGGVDHRLVCLGDYIDRGPDSAGVVSLLRRLETSRGAGRVVCLKGNHEDILAGGLHDPELLEVWLRNGGGETLESYRVARASDLPPDAVAWMASRPTHLDDGRRCFVHAGLNPAFDLARQNDRDRLWIRQAFLASDHDFGRFVVHGHTPCRGGAPDLRLHRVNLDTAAVYGGRLTAGIFKDSQDAPVGFLQVQ